MAAAPERLDSLDVFRGLSIAAMILVSTPGSWTAVYTPLDHALWHGWTMTDLVFPFLLFAMGAAVPFALARRRGTPRRLATHVVRRAVVLFALGLLLNVIEASAPLQWGTFRIPGVLQRIAIVFVAVAWLTEHGSLRAQIATVAAALAGYWALLTLVPVPGRRRRRADAGGQSRFVSRSGAARPSSPEPLHDPEGLLSTLPAMATAMAGVFAGDWLKERRQTHRSAWLFMAGVIAMVAGLAWGRVFPINKNLWTSSFALFSGGLAAQALALFHWLVDVRGLARVVAAARGIRTQSAGRVFLLGRLRQPPHALQRSRGGSLKGVVYRGAFVPWLRPCCGAEAASLGYALAYVALWGVILGAMYRRRIFIRI